MKQQKCWRIPTVKKLLFIGNLLASITNIILIANVYRHWNDISESLAAAQTSKTEIIICDDTCQANIAKLIKEK